MPDTLPMPTVPETPAGRVEALPGRAGPPAALAPAVEPLLLSAPQAARMCGISPATWHRLRTAGKVGPSPVKLGGRVLWSVAELRSWVTAPRGPEGQLPDRRTWEALQAAQRNDRPR